MPRDRSPPPGRGAGRAGTSDRDAPRLRGPREESPIAEPERPIRKVRTEHGTRVARSITCSSCGSRDTIHFAPKDPTKVLCRRCAADLLGVDDPDTHVGSMHVFVCSSCGRSGMTQLRVKRPEEFLCRDCLLGIESRQDDKAKRATRVSKRVLRVRKNDDDT